MAPTRYLIIGASAAGNAAAQAIRELDPRGFITVLSAEPDPPYFRPLLPFLIEGKKRVEDLALVGQGPFTADGIEVRLNAVATAVDPPTHTVVVNDAEALPYDKLLIASGGRPNLLPSLAATSVPGVIAPRTLADARAILDRIPRARHAVLAGGGMANLKMAFALLGRGLAVTMVEALPQLLPRIMEVEAASPVADALSRAGVRVITGHAVTDVVAGPGGVAAALLDDGQEIPCQMVCIGTGVRPNVEFLAGSGIRVGQGVVVDERTSCSAPDVYAAGDVAETLDPITGSRAPTRLWTNAVEMGRCAGRNMAGQPTVYAGAFGVLNATQVAEVPFVSMGIVHTAGTEHEVHVERAPGRYHKVVFAPANGEIHLVGAVLVGDISRAGLYRHLIRERAPVDGLRGLIAEHRLHYGHILRL